MTPAARHVLTTVLASAALCAAAPAASAATYFVDRDSRGGACSDLRTAAENTASTPWCTIASGLRAAPDGSVVAVRAGAYPKLTVTDLNRSGPVTLAPRAGEVPTIAGMHLERVAKLRFEGLRITAGVNIRTASDLQFVGNEVSAVPAGAATESGFTTAALKRGSFVRNRVHDTFNGVTVTAGSSVPNSDITIWGNHFEDLGNDGVGISAGTSRIVVGRNDFENVRPRADMDPAAHADGIQALGPASGVLIWGNRVHGGGRGFLLMVSTKHQLVPGAGLTGVLVQNNVFSGSQDFAIRSFSTPGARFINNTAWNNHNGGIDLRNRMGTVNATSTGMTLANTITRNLYVGAGTSFSYRDHNLMTRGPLSGRNDRLGTPSFVDPVAGDFRLQAASPGIDASDTAKAPLLDQTGAGRSDRADLGAVERAALLLASPFASLPAEVASVVNASGAAADVQVALAFR